METEGRSAIYLSDMSLCRPRTALSRETRKGCWRLVDYEAEGVAGTLMYALDGMDAQNVEYPLNAQGWHNIYISLWSFVNDTRWVKLKLTSDPCFTFMSREKPDRSRCVA